MKAEDEGKSEWSGMSKEEAEQARRLYWASQRPDRREQGVLEPGAVQYEPRVPTSRWYPRENRRGIRDMLREERRERYRDYDGWA